METTPDQNHLYNKQAQMNILAFWILIGAEVIVFGCLFGIYLAVKTLTDDGPGPKERCEKVNQHQNEIRHLSLSFILMIALTAIAFSLVLFQLISPPFLITLLLALAIIQIIIQLDRFMDIRVKERYYRLTYLIGGSFVALLTIIIFILP